MLRIEVQANGGNTVKAAGRLAGPWVAELARVLDRLAPTEPVVIDLTDVSFADAAGVALLRAVRHRNRVQLRCSAFLAVQLAYKGLPCCPCHRPALPLPETPSLPARLSPTQTW
jgi:ABC-type transporter Mla MlaB component